MSCEATDTLGYKSKGLTLTIHAVAVKAYVPGTRHKRDDRKESIRRFRALFVHITCRAVLMLSNHCCAVIGQTKITRHQGLALRVVDDAR